MMYRYVLRLDIDAIDDEERILINDNARRVYTTAYIDPSAKEHEDELIRKMADSMTAKLRETQ